MPGITQYDQYMQEPTGKGRIASYHDHRADTGAAAAVIDWGRAVQYNSANPNKVDTYDGAAGSVVGVAISDEVTEYRVQNVDDAIVGQYDANDPVSFLRRGRIWVEVVEDVTKGNQAVADNATGDFRPSSTATTGISGVVGVFKTSAVAGDLAQLEINLP